MRSVIISIFMTIAFIGSAHAAIINFDDLGNNDPIPLGYQGFEWENARSFQGTTSTAGFFNGVVSPNNVAYTIFSFDLVLSRVNSGELFDFNSAYFTAGWRNNLDVTITGLLNSIVTESLSFSISIDSPTFIEANFLGIDQLIIGSSGGIRAPNVTGDGTQVVIDDITYNAAPAIPEPSTILLMSLGLAGILACRRLRG